MNRRYFKYLLKKNKKLLLVLSTLATVLYCSSLLTTQDSYFITQGIGLTRLLSLNLSKIYLIGFVIVYPVYMHIKNYKQNGNDLVLSIPISKEKRYLCELVVGWILLVIPYIIIILLTYLMNNNYLYTISRFRMLILNLLILLPITMLYLLNQLIAMKSNNLVDVIILIVTLSLIFYLLPSVMMSFFDNNSNGFNYYSLSYGAKTAMISISLVMLILSLFSPFEAIDLLGIYMQSEGANIIMLILILCVFYIIYIVFLMFLNLIGYRNKKSEDYGGKTTSRIGYPVVIFLTTFILITVANTQNNFILACIGYVIIFCIFMSAYFIYQRKIYISLKNVVFFFMIIIFSLSLRSVYVYTYGFNTWMSYHNIENASKYTIDKNESYLNTILYRYDLRTYYDKDNQEKINKELAKFQDELLDEYRQNNLWWYANDKEINVYIAYEDDNNNITNYKYKLDKKTFYKLEALLNELGFEKESF